MKQISYLITLFGCKMIRENKLTGYVNHILTLIKTENDIEHIEFEQIDFSKCLSHKTLYETDGEEVNDVLRTLLSNGLISELRIKQGDIKNPTN